MYLGRQQRINTEGQTSQTAHQEQGGDKQSQPVQSLHADSRLVHTVQEGQGGNKQSQAPPNRNEDGDVATGEDEQTAGGMNKY